MPGVCFKKVTIHEWVDYLMNLGDMSAKLQNFEMIAIQGHLVKFVV
jgi:hypothetical protein